MSFEKNVFINCPFDKKYLSLLRPLLFTVIYLNLKPRIALESMDSGQSRFDKIVELIRESRYGIHDLSRMQATTIGELFRLNMPFELGMDFGCRIFGQGQQRDKRSLVLEAEDFRYKAALSDLSGADIANHANKPQLLVGVVRNWLANVCHIDPDGPSKIFGAYTDFMADNYTALKAKGFSDRDVKALPVSELIECMDNWIRDQRA